MGYGDVSGCQGLAVAKPDDEALLAHRTGEWGGHVQSLVGWFPVVRGHGPRPHVACDRGCAWAGGASVMFHCLSSVCGSLMTTNPIGAPVLVAMDSLDALRVYFKPDPVRYGYTMRLIHRV